MRTDELYFKRTLKDGSAIKCKFCHSPVWWNQIEGRMYDVGGESLHVDNCALRQLHFHNRALDSAESRRK